MPTHDREEASAVAARFVVMNRGAMDQVSTPLEIYREPASPFVADFIGVMNFVAGTVVRDGTVRLGRTELACDADGFAAGTDATLAVRPEGILVEDRRDEAPHTLALRCDAVAVLWSC